MERLEEKILVKDKQYLYTGRIRVTYDRALIRCVPSQSRNGRRTMFDSRTIYAPLANDQGGPQMTYYAGQTSRIDSRQINEANVPQSVEESTTEYTTLTPFNLDRWEVESIDE